jgi:hypothetical protein
MVTLAFRKAEVKKIPSFCLLPSPFSYADMPYAILSKKTGMKLL